MTKKRRLTDLYQVGRAKEFDDGSGEPIRVWLQKLNPLEVEQSARQAGAAKARVLIGRNDRESDEWLNTYNEVLEMGHDTLVSVIVAEELGKALESADAEIGAGDEWAKDGYLQGLRDSWIDGLAVVHELGDESHVDWPEAKRVHAELERFDKAVNKRVDGERERLVKDYEEVNVEDLYEKVSRRIFEIKGDSAWMIEYRRSQVFFGVRDFDNRKERYFETRKEVDTLDTRISEELIEAMTALTVDSLEGKDLPPTQDSLEQSEQPNEVETAAPSGPLVAAQ